MDQRPCYRLPVEIDVWLYQNDTLFAKAHLSNVSRDGMFIRTDVMLLSLGSTLRVCLEINEGGKLKQVSFRVKVIHRCLDGVGVQIERNLTQDGASIVSLLAQITAKSYQDYEENFAA